MECEFSRSIDYPRRFFHDIDVCVKMFLQAAFGRLGLRHLHFLLRQSHDEAQNLHKSYSTTPRKSPSFERRWAEGKRLRAGLRADFYDQRNRYSNKRSKSQLRSGRQSSLTQ